MDWRLILQELWIFVAVPVVRSLGGWLQHALEDNKITWPEWKKMIETVLRVGIMGLVIWLIPQGMGFEVEAIVAAATAFLLDLILRAIKYPEQRIVKQNIVTHKTVYETRKK